LPSLGNVYNHVQTEKKGYAASAFDGLSTVVGEVGTTFLTLTASNLIVADQQSLLKLRMLAEAVGTAFLALAGSYLIVADQQSLIMPNSAHLQQAVFPLIGEFGTAFLTLATSNPIVGDQRSFSVPNRFLLQMAAFPLVALGKMAFKRVITQIEEGGKSLGNTMGNNLLGNQLEQYPKASLSIIGSVFGLATRSFDIWSKANSVSHKASGGKGMIERFKSKVAKQINNVAVVREYNTWKGLFKDLDEIRKTRNAIMVGAVAIPTIVGFGYTIFTLPA